MSITVEPWQIEQLLALLKESPDAVLGPVATLFAANPDLYHSVVVRGVSTGAISVEEAGRQTPLSEQDIAERARSISPSQPSQATIEMNGKGARLVGSGLYVWEIIRELRRLGSVDGLREQYSLTDDELVAARVYAAENSEEVESQIGAFEELKNRKHAEYPSLA